MVITDSSTDSVHSGQQTSTILASVILSITLSPLTFHWTTCINASSKQSDLIAFLLTLILSGVIALIINNILSRRSQKLTVNLEKPTLLKKTLLRVFSSSSLSSSPLKSSVEHTRYNYANSGSPKIRQSKSNIRIDPKYFSPKYIVDELMSIWGTTYIVISWGTVWVVGGTILASEKLAHKIRTRYSRDPHPQQHQQHQHNSDNFSRDRSRSYTSLSSNDSYSSSNDLLRTRSSIKRFRSWTKRSYATARKRFNKFVHGSSMPQLTGRIDENTTTS